nr:MAG TPA: hypothetical protein [Caudoviricetes sp.]
MNNKAQKQAADVQSKAQQAAMKEQARANSQAQQNTNRANANKVDAGAILGAISQGYTGNLTSSNGVDKGGLSLGTSSSLGTLNTLSRSNPLGSAGKLGGKTNGKLF